MKFDPQHVEKIIIAVVLLVILALASLRLKTSPRLRLFSGHQGRPRHNCPRGTQSTNDGRSSQGQRLNTMALEDDLKHPSDCWEDEGVWDDLRDEPRMRHYAKIVADVKERLGCPNLGEPFRRKLDNDSDY